MALPGGRQKSDPTQWWRENGEATRRRCIAISDYALIQTDTGQLIAGCRGPWNVDQALRHWGPREDDRAVAFVAAIERHGDQVSEAA